MLVDKNKYDFVIQSNMKSLDLISGFFDIVDITMCVEPKSIPIFILKKNNSYLETNIFYLLKKTGL